MMKEHTYCIFQVKQDFNFDEKTYEWFESGSIYTDLIAYGRSKKPLKDFANIAWDLCNIFCWEDKPRKIYNETITRNDQDFIDPIPANFSGIANSDIFICSKNNPSEYYIADIFGWIVKGSKEEAEQHIIENNPIIKHFKK